MFNHVHYVERQNTVCLAGHPMFDDKLGHSKIPNAGPKFFHNKYHRNDMVYRVYRSSVI